MALRLGTKIAGYKIERVLGSGGMGEVYLAQHPNLPRRDALKVLRSDISADPDFIERFNREANLAAKLWHPHIVGIHDRGKYRGRVWISMDFVDGTDVGHLMDAQYPDGMPAQDALAVITAVASALDYAHGMGMLHRDVKPANILVADVEHADRRILLGDFGVAQDLSDNTSGGLTATNMTVGTAAYAAPEQLMGLSVDGRTDQYSLAATAYHLLNGAPPFQHSNPAVVIGKHLNATASALAVSRPELASFDAALLKALAKDPDERFASCMEFARSLADSKAPPVRLQKPSDADTMVREAPQPPPPMEEVAWIPISPPPAYVGTSRRRNARIALAAGAAVVVVVAVLVAALVVQSTDGPPPAEPFTLAGTLQLSSDTIRTADLPSGYKCAGARDYSDIAPGAPVTVEDESGKLLAKGAIRSSSNGDDGCVLKFRIEDVPAGAKFYRVHVAQHPEVSYTEAEAKAGVEFLMEATSPDPTTATEAPPSNPTATRTTTRTVTAPTNVEQDSLNRLRAIANDDRVDVNLYFADKWIPQISSKRVGLVAEGTVWDNQKILDEHLRLRRIYPDVKLLWSGEWSTFDGRDFWITVVGRWADDPNAILNWCTTQGFDRDHCIAKVVSTWRPVDGSTRLN